jgi:hypothetical protein
MNTFCILHLSNWYRTTWQAIVHNLDTGAMKTEWVAAEDYWEALRKAQYFCAKSKERLVVSKIAKIF